MAAGAAQGVSALWFREVGPEQAGAPAFEGAAAGLGHAVQGVGLGIEVGAGWNHAM